MLLLNYHMKSTELDDDSFYRFFVPLNSKKIKIFILIIGMVVFFNMLFNNFAADDSTFILNNTLIRSGNIFSAFGPNIFNSLGQYRPFTVIYYMVLFHIFTNTPFFYHLIQLCLHISCSILLFLFLQRFFNLGISFFMGLLFLVHPINVESVAYISQTDSPLSLLLGLIALLLATKKKLSSPIFFCILLCCLASIFIKETGILILFLLPLYRFLFTNKDRYKLMGISVLVALIYFTTRFYIGQVSFALRETIPIATLPLNMRVLSIPLIIFSYIKTFLYPSILSFDQQWIITKVSFYYFTLPLIADCTFFIIILTYGIFLFFKKNKMAKLYFFFCFWFITSISLYLQLVPLDNTVADRWFYFPIIGLIGIIGIVIQEELSVLPHYRIFAIYLSCFIIFLLCVRTIARNANWYDDQTLYIHDIKYANSYSLDNDIGSMYIVEGNYRLAIAPLTASVNLFPIDINLFNLGQAYIYQGNKKKALFYFSQIKNHYTGSIPISTIIPLLLKDNDPKDSIFFIKMALLTKPHDNKIRKYLIQAKCMQKLNKQIKITKSGEVVNRKTCLMVKSSMII